MLDRQNNTACIMIKLMMACNDLQSANQALAHFKNVKSSRKTGSALYFIRIQLGHLWEAFKVLEVINQHAELMKLMGQCDVQTRESFKILQQYLPGKSRRTDLEKWVGQVRHNLTFHYHQSDTLIKRAISNRAIGIGSKISSLTRGSTADLWHFKVADDLVDSIVCRQIWKIPPDKDLRVKADKIAEETFHIYLKFMDFSGEFIWKYFEQ